jgi:DNA-binding XRE family transcriptional regulator
MCFMPQLYAPCVKSSIRKLVLTATHSEDYDPQTLRISVDNMTETPDSREAIAARLIRVREIIGLNKTEMAAQLGISVQALSGYETANRDLTLETAKRLRRVHGVPLDFIFFGNKGDLPHRIAAKL